MQNIKDKLEQLLQKDDRLTADGKLMKNKVVELAHKLDKDLLKLLMSSDTIKKHFFEEIDGTLVFDKVKFQDFINLKEFLADSYTRYKSKIGLQVNGEYLAKSKDVVLVWPYKDCILEGGQTKNERENRMEIFWNETLAPDQINRLLSLKALSNFKRYDKKGETALSGKVDFSNENLIVKGNNLLVLHSLQERFARQVKLIYIDPPYNTGSDEFGYNDSFDHSTWMTFMKNRLELAKELLRNDGVIFIQIDERELAYLKLVADEVFGRDNFLTQINWQRTTQRSVLGQGATPIINIMEYILPYANSTSKKENVLVKTQKIIPSNDKMYNQYNLRMISEGTRTLHKTVDHNGYEIKIYKHKKHELKSIPTAERTEDNYVKLFEQIVRKDSQQQESSLEQLILSNISKDDTLYSVERVLKQGKHKGKLKKSLYVNDNVVYYLKDHGKVIDNKIFRIVDMNNIWLDHEISSAGIANEGGVKLKRGKKPEALLKRIFQVAGCGPEDLIIDFHLGSGTTVAVAHKMGIRYVGIEQLDYGENDSIIRLKNVINGDDTGVSDDDDVKWKGGGSFIYCELAKDNARFIDQIEEAKDTKALKKIWETMQKEGFISYRVDETKVFEDDKEGKFSELSLNEKKQILIRTLDLNQLYVNYSEIDDKRYNIIDEIKELNKQFYTMD